jgi:hypothetical protein
MKIPTFEDWTPPSGVTIERIREITERARKQMQRTQPDEVASYYRCAPRTGSISPRDHGRLGQTTDVLFLALLLETCQDGWIEETRASNGRYQYQTIVKPPHPMPKGSRFLKRATVRDFIRKSPYFDLRRLMSNPNGHEITIPELHLKHPIQEGQDPFEGLDLERDFRSWSGKRYSRLPKNGNVLCPLCGPSPLVKVEISTPDVTWRRLCGRVFHSWACSGCLGEIECDTMIFS